MYEDDWLEMAYEDRYAEPDYEEMLNINEPDPEWSDERWA
jgi:hypothetical protein